MRDDDAVYELIEGLLLVAPGLKEGEVREPPLVLVPHVQPAVKHDGVAADSHDHAALANVLPCA